MVRLLEIAAQPPEQAKPQQQRDGVTRLDMKVNPVVFGDESKQKEKYQAPVKYPDQGIPGFNHWGRSITCSHIGTLPCLTGGNATRGSLSET